MDAGSAAAEDWSFTAAARRQGLMASSRIDHESGEVVVTTPGVACSVGDRFFIAGSAASFGIAYSDWILRLVEPLPPWRGQTSGTPNHDLAQERLREQLRSGEVHPTLVEEPRELAA